MTKLSFTKKEIEDIKSKIYLSNDEENVLDLWLRDATIIESSIKLNMSERSICRKRKSILNKIKRVI